MFPYRLFPFSFALLALAPFTAADTLTVGPVSSGAQFSQIQAAIDAAQDDDVILVQSGTYQAIVVDKPLRILGAGPGGVTISASGHCVIVRDIGAGEELVLSGAEIEGTNSMLDFLPAVLLEDCPGTVVLQDVVVRNGEWNAPLYVENCGRVVLLDSRVSGGGAFLFSPRAAVYAADSTLWVANSEIEGAVDYAREYPAACDGFRVWNSTLHVWSTSIRGGSFNGNNLNDEQASSGGSGVSARASTVYLFGGPHSTVVGGRGALIIFGPYAGGPGVRLFDNSHALIQANIPIQGGLNGTGTVQAPAVSVDGTSSFTLDPKIFPTLVSSAPRVQVGSSFRLTLEGNAGGYQVLYLSLRTGPTSTIRGVDGLGLLDSANLFKILSEILPASGARNVTFRVPSTPALIGSTFFFQNVERFPNSALRQLTPSNRFAIGNPVLVTIAP